MIARRTSVLAVSLLVTLPVVASGCESTGKRAGNRQPIKAGDSYVALGDSFTSAPGLGESTAQAGCLQTSGNYPHLLAEAADLELTDVSCGGAKIADLTGRQRPADGGPPLPPQVDALDEDTDLVTLSIGGNDGKTYGTLVTSCVALAQQDPQGSPCTDLADENDHWDDVFDDIAEDLDNAVDEVRRWAPNARLVMIGYPEVFPAEGQGTCAELPLAAGDYPFARRVFDRLVEIQKQAAKNAGAEFIDTRPATAGHGICGEEPWIAGAVPTRPATAWHPYAEAQEAVTDLLLDWLDLEGTTRRVAD